MTQTLRATGRTLNCSASIVTTQCMLLAGIAAVSYTHLDVYKRQMEINAHTDQPAPANAEIDKKIEALTAKLEAAKAINAKAAANNQLNARISALLKSENDLSACLLYTSRCV